MTPPTGMVLGRAVTEPTLAVNPFDLVVDLTEGPAEEYLGIEKGAGVLFHAVAENAPNIGRKFVGDALIVRGSVVRIRPVRNAEEVLLRVFIPPTFYKECPISIGEIHLHAARDRFEETVEVAVDHAPEPPITMGLG